MIVSQPSSIASANMNSSLRTYRNILLITVLSLFINFIITLLPLSAAPVRSSLLIYSSNPSGSPGKDHGWIGVGS